jgi:hypothetical protein
MRANLSSCGFSKCSLLFAEGLIRYPFGMKQPNNTGAEGVSLDVWQGYRFQQGALDSMQTLALAAPRVLNVENYEAQRGTCALRQMQP